MASALDILQQTDESLAAEAAREGSEGPAFAALYQRYEERVWRVCYRLMGSADDASDAAQEVFVRLFFQRAKFAGRSKYSTWVHGIALRVCLEQRRSRGRRRTHEAGATERFTRERGHSEPVDSGAALDLAQMLEILDDEDRALLILKYAEGYNHDELAAMFDLSTSACKMRIHRAIQRLKEHYPDQHFGDEETD